MNNSSGTSVERPQRASLNFLLKVIFLLFLSFGLIFSLRLERAYALGTVPDTPPPAWSTGTMSFGAVGDYFTSSANYNSGGGSYTNLSNGASFSNLEMRLRGRYAFTPQLMVFIGADAAESHTSDNLTQQSNSQFTEASVGVDYLFARRWFRLVPELEVIVPANPTSGNETSPLTSDGATVVRAGTFLFKRYEQFRLEGYLGAHMPNDGLASRFMGSLIAEVAFLHGFSLGGGIDGYHSIVYDTSSQVQRSLLQVQSSDGSERFWAYNPNLLEGKVWIGFRPDRATAIRLGYAHTINGANTAEGQSVMLSVSFNTAGSRDAAKEDDTPVDVPAVETRSDRAKFKTEPETVDPEVFPSKRSDIKNGNDLDNTERQLENKKPQ